MCGVVGFVGDVSEVENQKRLVSLLTQSRIRGRHAYGSAWKHSGERVSVFKTLDFAEHLAKVAGLEGRVTLIAHNRYSTSGDWHVLENNQPLVVHTMALAFNGVLSMKTKQEMEYECGWQFHTDNDGEIFIGSVLLKGMNPEEFVRTTRGSFAGCYLTEVDDFLFAVRNERRPLWALSVDGALFVASTRNIFERAGFPVKYAYELTPCLLYRF